MALKFILKKKNSKEFKTDNNGEAPIYIQYSHRSDVALFSTGLKLNPTFWKGDKDQTNPVKKTYSGFIKMNGTLRKLRTRIDDVILRMTDEYLDPIPRDVKLRLQANQTKHHTQRSDIIGLIEQYIKLVTPKMAPTTIKGYNTFKNHFETFLVKNKKKCTLGSINRTLIDEFHNYLLEEKNLRNNSTQDILKNLKAFLNSMKKKGNKIGLNPDSIKVKFENPQTVIYLTQSEFKQLADYDFSNKPRLERVRDLFVLGARTGLRYSDLKRLSKHHVKTTEFTDEKGTRKVQTILMTAHKNKKQIVVPLVMESSVILRKYHYKLPEISDQKFNDYIKEACQIAELNRNIEVISYKGGNKVYTKVELWKLVSSHKAVNTFITHSVEKGTSPKTVSEITGKTVKVLLNHYYGSNESFLIREMYSAFGEPTNMSAS
jgi:site-specific recombinase XerD